MAHTIDLDAYFARIGYRGARTPTLETLRAISHAHVTCIPFESLDVLLGRPILLELEALEAKLVHGRRGGYCFEQNGLLLAVLEALGYAVRPISGRVRVNRPREMTPPRTHLILRVELEGEAWIVDAGVGAWSLTSPVRLVLDQEQATPHEPRRFLADGDWDGLERRSPSARLFHQIRLGDAWQDVCELTLEEMPPIDRVVANWYTSTHPLSTFKSQLLVARATESGRLTLVDDTLTRRARDGSTVTETYTTHAALIDGLAREFGIVLDPATRLGGPRLSLLG
ncbi:MAG: arylamine N-acetyltransferase [Deltaproteobacteria bacterium]|nr:arylamine N-acetyltransferase [Deltaproteobacteria bacterium]